MTEAKLKRLIVAVTVGAVLLLIILLFTMVCLLVSIQSKKNEYDYYQEQIAHYEKLIEEGEETLEARSLRVWIEREARRLGYVYE